MYCWPVLWSMLLMLIYDCGSDDDDEDDYIDYDDGDDGLCCGPCSSELEQSLTMSFVCMCKSVCLHVSCAQASLSFACIAHQDTLA